MSYSEFTPKDYEVIEREFADLQEAARKRCRQESEMDFIQRAFEFANEAHKNVRRRSGEPYMLHPIAVAKIVVSDIGLGYKSISAALLHDVVEDTDYTVDDIRRFFGDKVASLVDGLTKIKNVLDSHDKTRNDAEFAKSMQAENFKRILLTMNDDVRVVLIKLADRLHNCRTIEYMPEYKRDKILSETMFIFIPLAHRLGLYEVKSEMENIWLRYKEPDAYNEISQKINRNISDRAKDIDEFIKPIEETLTAGGFDFSVRKRVKTPYSIWRKMQTKNIPFEQVYDLYAIRIIFTPDANSKDTERDQCYHVFSRITGIYRYKPDRVRDWVVQPKSNGYEALHCTLQSKKGIWIEVQIRTRRMDDIAEKGIAAHWAYKREGYVGENDSEMEKWLNKIKEILVSPDINALELLDIIHNDLTTYDIVIFTPKGEQKSIQKGSTALDFAYQIHSKIGEKAIAAKINMKLVPLSATIHSGDTVEIITAGTGEPKAEWLSFLQTRHAKNKVLDFFRKDYENIVASARAKLDEELAVSGRKYKEHIAGKIAAEMGYNNAGEMLFRYGLGMIRFEDMDKHSSENQPVAIDRKNIDRNSLVIGSRNDTHKYIIASCCRPIPGDPIVGFLAPDGTITVHKKTCVEAESLAARHGDWIVMPKWETDSLNQDFLIRISLRGVDRLGILNEITNYISLSLGVNIKRLNLGTEQGIFDGYIDVLVREKSVLEDMISHLRQINGVQTVQRTDIV